MKDYSKEELESNVVYYCTRCMSLHILGNESGTDIWCESCGRKHYHPKWIDVTTMDKWQKLYIQRTGHHPLAPEPDQYADLHEQYEQDTYNPEPTKDEIYEAGLNYSERMNRKIKD